MMPSLQKALNVLRCSLTPNRPYHVQWFLTRRCNYRCKGCNVWREQEGEELPADRVKEGLDILRRLGVMEVVFSGGNPLLRDDIDEILSYASKYFMTTVYDNGSLAAKKIDALRDVDFVAISLDTLNEEQNDYVKGMQGAWRTAVDAIKELRSEGISVAVSPTISQLNLHEIVPLTKYFTDRKVPVWYCLYGYDVAANGKLFGIGREDNEFEIIDKKGLEEVCDALTEMKRDVPGILVTTKTIAAMKELFLNGRRTWKCKALQNFFVIDHLGRVGGCHCLRPVASVFELLDVWNSSRFERLRKEYSECCQCAYLCYIVYSLHVGVRGNLEIIWDQWRNAKLLLSSLQMNRKMR